MEVFQRTLSAALIACMMIGQLECSQMGRPKKIPSPENVGRLLHKGDKVRIKLKDGTAVEGDVVDVSEKFLTLKVLYRKYEKHGLRAKFPEYAWRDIVEIELKSRIRATESLRTAVVLSAIVLGIGFGLLIAVTESLED